MPHSTYPKDLDEKIPLEKPDLWDIDDFTGHRRMAISRGNTMLKDIFRNTKTDLPKLIASVRWSLLQKPYKDYAIAAGISPSGYKTMEKDKSAQNKAHLSKYTKLLDYWEKKDISAGVREQLLDLLTNPDLLALHPSCTDLLSAIEYIRQHALQVIGAEHIDAFYHRLGYDLGHEHVRKQCQKCFGTKNIYNTSWQRKKTGTIPSYTEIQTIVDTLYNSRRKSISAMRELRHTQGEALWTEAKRNQYNERGLEEPLADVLVAIEKDLAVRFRETLTQKALQQHYGFGSLHGQQLIQSELIEGEAIDPVITQVVEKGSRKKVRVQWDEAYEKEQERLTFGKLCAAAMDERGYTAGDVAKLVGVVPPEQRGKQGKEDRGQRYRPDSEVRNVLFNNHTSSQIAVEALIQVIATDDEHVGRLREMYFSERERFYKRKGDWVHGDGLTMRILRELANVDMRTLAQHFLPRKQQNSDTIRAKNLELQRLERQEGKEHTMRFGQVFTTLKRIAAQRGEEALERVQGLDTADESLKNFSTVQEMAANLAKYCKGGAKSISEVMRDIARNDSEWLRSDLITDMAEGKFVSALPPLRMMAKGTIDAVLPEAVVRNWHELFPVQLQKGVLDFGKVEHPLARVLCTLIARLEANPIRFFADRVPGIVPTIGTKYLRTLDKGKSVEWRHIHKCLLGVGLRPGQPTYQFVKILYENDGNVPETLKQVVPIFQQAKLEVHPIHFPGLTLEELASGRNAKKPRK